MKENSTIAAIATALSPAGISIIRISGPQALDVIDRIYRTKKEVESIKKGAFAAAASSSAPSEGRNRTTEKRISTLPWPS